MKVSYGSGHLGPTNPSSRHKGGGVAIPEVGEQIHQEDGESELEVVAQGEGMKVVMKGNQGRGVYPEEMGEEGEGVVGEVEVVAERVKEVSYKTKLWIKE